MPSVRYKNGVKLAGGLYFSGCPADRPVGFSGSDWESSVFKLEVTLSGGDLTWGGGTSNSGVTEDSLVAVRNPWMWTRTDSTDTYTGNWAVIYGDGTVTRQGTGTHTYPSAGVYQFSVVGTTGLVNFSDNSSGNPKVTKILNMGQGIERQYGGPFNFVNAQVDPNCSPPMAFAGPRTFTLPAADFDATDWWQGWLNIVTWTGHNGSGVFNGWTNFNNAGIGGVGVGLDTWDWPADQDEWTFTGTVTALTPNGLIDSNAQFDVDLARMSNQIRHWAVINTDTGATAMGVNSDNVTATQLSGFKNSGQVRSQVGDINVPKDIFTAVGQGYKLVPHWTTNSNFGGLMNNMTSFNQYIGSWNMQGLVECFGGFWTWTNFNNGDAAGFAGGGVGQGMDNWDVSTSVSLFGMPTRGTAFNQYINSWNVGNNQAFQSFFDGNSVYNRPLDNWNIGEHLSPGQWVNMSNMFRNATAFNQELTAWDVSKVTTMQGMFQYANAFNNAGVGGSGVGLDTWDTSNVRTMQDMFYDSPVFDQDIGNWDVGRVTTAHGMFERTDVFNSKPTSGNWGANLAAGETVNLSNMFAANDVFNQDVGYFDTSRVIYMASMFDDCGAFNNGGVGGVGLGMDQWDVSLCYSFNRFLEGAPSFNQYLGSWTFLTGDTSTGTNSSVVSGQLVDSSKNFITDGVETGMRVINNVTKKQATVTLPSLLYNGQRNNNPAPFKLIDTASVDYIAVGVVPGYIVNNLDSGASATVVSVDGPKELTLTADIFPLNNQRYSIQPTQHLVLSDDIFTASGTSYSVFRGIDMQSMFQGVRVYTAQSMTNWNTENVHTMYAMFLYTGVHSNTDFSQWDVSRCTNFGLMFRPFTAAEASNPDVTNWDVSSATTLASMFYDNTAMTRDISGWDTRNVESINSMFRNTSVNTTDFSGWNIQSLTNAASFYPGNMSTANYDAMLDSTTGWASQSTIQSNVTLSSGSGSGPQYTAGGNAEAGRNILTGTYGWTIVDAGPV